MTGREPTKGKGGALEVGDTRGPGFRSEILVDPAPKAERGVVAKGWRGGAGFRIGGVGFEFAASRPQAPQGQTE